MDLTENQNNSHINCDEISDILKQSIQYYRDQNNVMEQTLLKLSLLNEELNMENSIKNVTGYIRDVLLQTNVSKPCTIAPNLSQTEMLRKHSNYSAKLKICIKLYITLNEKLSKGIKLLKNELEISQKKLSGVCNLSKMEVKQLEEKIKRYEAELLKNEKKYPWLLDQELDFPDISKQIDRLKGLRKEKDKLLKDLEIYQGLSPDLKEATKQLEQVKLENTKLSAKLINSQK